MSLFVCVGGGVVWGETLKDLGPSPCVMNPLPLWSPLWTFIKLHCFVDNTNLNNPSPSQSQFLKVPCSCPTFLSWEVYHCTKVMVCFLSSWLPPKAFFVPSTPHGSMRWVGVIFWCLFKAKRSALHCFIGPTTPVAVTLWGCEIGGSLCCVASFGLHAASSTSLYM